MNLWKINAVLYIQSLKKHKEYFPRIESCIGTGGDSYVNFTEKKHFPQAYE